MAKPISEHSLRQPIYTKALYFLLTIAYISKQAVCVGFAHLVP